MQDVFARLGLQVFQRDWLSSNNILFAGGRRGPVTIVDTGYATHAEQTVALVEHALRQLHRGAPLGRIVNTHLHSDHCGGNAALHRRWPCEIVVPSPSFDIVRQWDTGALTFNATGQQCERFPAHQALSPGDTIELGPCTWQVHGVGGHDPDAVVLFEPEHRVLISGDALWQHRVAIIFPELAGDDGFGPALASLDHLASLSPAIVIPGHGAPFVDVAEAISRSRDRLERFRRDPGRHLQSARRALLMFHMLEHRRRPQDALVAWARDCVLLRSPDEPDWPQRVIEDLVADGVLRRREEMVEVSTG